MSHLRVLGPFLALVFIGTLSNSAIIPFMGFYLVDTLEEPPWMLSLYSGLAVALTVGLNRLIARRIDSGARVFPLVGFAATGFLIASLSLSLAPGLGTVFTVAILGYGISSTAISTKFSLGGHLAERAGLARSTFNAWMRATTSAAWMIGPAASFVIAGEAGAPWVFRGATGLAILWLVLWALVLPRTATAGAPAKTAEARGDASGLWMAAAFIMCLSIAHGLTFHALPLYWVREVGLPDFAPGLGLSVKTFVEIFAIFSTPFLIARFGLRGPLLVTACLAVGAILTLSMVQTLPQMGGAMALEGLYYGLYASIGMSFVQSFAPDRPAQATAIYWNTLMVSGLLAGPAVGLIAQVWSFQAVVQVAAGVAALSVGILLIGSRHPARPSKSMQSAETSSGKSSAPE